MEGGGHYTEHSEAQEAYGELGFEWLEQAAAEVDPPAAPLPFVIADMGAAGGGNSLEPMARALAARRGDCPALVVHTDIPTNDFSALFQLVSDSPKTYLEDGVFPLAEGRSFYERLFPDGFLSLGWSSIAVHWLSAVPEPIPDHIYCSFATGSCAKGFGPSRLGIGGRSSTIVPASCARRGGWWCSAARPATTAPARPRG
jgi:S-adenosylmethionine-dependent carboxyl methyltransferase